MKLKFAFAVVSVHLLLISSAPNIQASLVGSYSFEEGAGSFITDASGRGNHGTLINPRTDTWTTGHSGKGLYLPGISGSDATYVNLGNPADFDFLTNAFTFTAWVYSTAPDTDAPILAKENNNDYGTPSYGTSYWFGAFYNGFGTLCDIDGDWGWDLDRRNIPVPNWNQWNHLASTWDGTTLRQYLNGSLVDSVPFSGPLAKTGALLTIGVNSGVLSTAFTGRLDDIKIFDNALSSAEVSRLAGTLVSGCVNLQGAPLANAKVMLKQDLVRKQTTETDATGCYKFGSITSGQTFKIEIDGPVVP